MKKSSYRDFDGFSAEDRRGVFTKAARDLGILPSNIEKDFWVCRVLSVIMKRRNNAEPCRTFKGGTSLSKGFRIISRFSEDVDIVIGRNGLLNGKGDDIVDAESALSARQRREGHSKLRKAARCFLHGDLTTRLLNELPGCQVSAQEHDKYQLNLLVSYQTVFPSINDLYSHPVVKIQPSIKAADFPTISKHISPYVASALPSSDWNLTVRSIPMIAPERTFWEKVMAIHSRHCKYRDSGFIEFEAKRFSRHYYDLAMLTESPAGKRALRDLQMLADVREHDKIAYADEKWRCPEEAVPGRIFVIPPIQIIPALTEDFEKMSGMMMENSVSFDWVMERIVYIHNKINVDLFPPALGKGRTVKSSLLPNSVEKSKTKLPARLSPLCNSVSKRQSPA